MAEPLAKDTDIEAILGRVLTDEEKARSGAVLKKLSELFRKESGQNFTPGESHVELKVSGGRVYLPQRPVDEVAEVTTRDGVPVSWTLFKQWLDVPLTSAQMVRVKYTHGSETVPDLVVSTIADAARQVLQIAPEAVSGMAQESDGAGPFQQSNSYAAWAQGGSTRLSPEDRATARSFRVKMGKVWVP